MHEWIYCIFYNIIEFVNKISEIGNSKLYIASIGIVITTNYNSLGRNTNISHYALVYDYLILQKIHHRKAAVVQSVSDVLLFATPWTAAHQASLFFIISQSLPKFMSIESVILSNHFIFCRPLLFLPSVFPSIRVFFNKSVLCIRWPKYCSFSFSIIGIYELKTMLIFKYHVITFSVWRLKITCMCNRQKDIYIVNTLTVFLHAIF